MAEGVGFPFPSLLLNEGRTYAGYEGFNWRIGSEKRS